MTKVERKVLTAWLRAVSLSLAGYAHDTKARERVWRLVGSLEWLVEEVKNQPASRLALFARSIERECCEHEWRKTGACLKCGTACLHSSFTVDKCDTCGFEREFKVVQ